MRKGSVTRLFLFWIRPQFLICSFQVIQKEWDVYIHINLTRTKYYFWLHTFGRAKVLTISNVLPSIISNKNNLRYTLSQIEQRWSLTAMVYELKSFSIYKTNTNFTTFTFNGHLQSLLVYYLRLQEKNFFYATGIRAFRQCSLFLLFTSYYTFPILLFFHPTASPLGYLLYGRTKINLLWWPRCIQMKIF